MRLYKCSLLYIYILLYTYMEYYPQLAHPGTLASSWQSPCRLSCGCSHSGQIWAPTEPSRGLVASSASRDEPVIGAITAQVFSQSSSSVSIWLRERRRFPNVFLLACAATPATTKNFDGMTNTRCMLHAMNDITCGKTQPV